MHSPDYNSDDESTDQDPPDNTNRENPPHLPNHEGNEGSDEEPRSQDQAAEMDHNQHATPIRRSQRTHRIPECLNDFAVEDGIDQTRGNELLLLFEGEPETFLEAKENKQWITAMRTEIESIEKNKTWTLVELPKDHRPIGLKWVYKLKKDAKGNVVKYKARLVAKGYVQKHGVDFDEVFAPVACMETVRMILALAATDGWQVHHLDVKSAFLNGELKEVVYVSQPDGFVKKGQEGKVYHLSKALYGLRQAPRAWNLKMDCTLRSLGYKRCPQEHSVYMKKDGTNLLLVGVYVDDLVVTGSNMSIIVEFKRQMMRQFEMSDLGLLNYYLGIEVQQGDSGIVVKQERYARRILREFGMGECNPAKCPMEPGVKLSKDEDDTQVDATLYKRIVGSLRYLINTRPDLAYSVGIVSRYMENPSSHIWQPLNKFSDT
ncbi:hypothetical protein E3N88_32937 [Mikania micrantha]|uniref:Reverse transcriptase Ty1/copia-type domain-containing protein n=1 Tax=Mikania micrantha TaxID=192012 RepID=A0A5N6MAD1_9ASTR|nr:hypothetical protein E3N88_32937 [Mikania micrantha]